jgi:DNA-binding response OmpR family regulator
VRQHTGHHAHGARWDTNIAKALEMGADDYVTKPFSFLELVARIRSQARRLNDSSTASRVEGTFSANGLTIHYATRDVKVDGRAVELTDTEYRLLYHLAQNAGRLMAYRSLLQLVWGSSRLRRKIELDPERPRYITTKAGLGYLFTASPETPALAGAASADEGNPN